MINRATIYVREPVRVRRDRISAKKQAQEAMEYCRETGPEIVAQYIKAYPDTHRSHYLKQV